MQSQRGAPPPGGCYYTEDGLIALRKRLLKDVNSGVITEAQHKAELAKFEKCLESRRRAEELEIKNNLARARLEAENIRAQRRAIRTNGISLKSLQESNHVKRHMAEGEQNNAHSGWRQAKRPAKRPPADPINNQQAEEELSGAEADAGEASGQEAACEEEVVEDVVPCDEVKVASLGKKAWANALVAARFKSMTDGIHAVREGKLWGLPFSKWQAGKVSGKTSPPINGGVVLTRRWADAAGNQLQLRGADASEQVFELKYITSEGYHYPPQLALEVRLL